MAHKSESDMFPLMDQWEESKATQAEFCKAHDIPLSTFTYWRGKYLASKSQQSPGFVKLEPGWTSSLEVVYPNGVKLRLAESTSLSEVRMLIQLV